MTEERMILMKHSRQLERKNKKFMIYKAPVRRLLALICVCALVIHFAGISVQAATIEGDSGKLKISSDASYLYISYSGDWSGYLGDKISVSADGAGDLGALSQIVLGQSNDGDGGSLTVLNSWYSAISGASGTVSNSDKKEYYGYEAMKWSIQVPISAYKDYTFSSMTFTWNGQSVTLPVKNGESTTENVTTEQESTTEKPENNTTEVTGNGDGTTESATTEQESNSGKPESNTTEPPGNGGGATEDTVSPDITESSTETSTEDNTTEDVEDGGNIVVSGGIQIDGMYDDWSNVPKTELSYGGNNGQNIHYGQLYTDGEYLYAHFQTNDLYGSQMPIQSWSLVINGQTFALSILPVRDGAIDWSQPMYPNVEGHQTNLQVFIGYYNACESNVVYTIYDANHGVDTPGDEIEFSFSMKQLAEITGIEEDQMGTITIYNSNLGSQGVTIAGSSTGPVASAVAAFMLAGCYVIRKRKFII